MRYEFGPFTLDTDARQLTQGADVVHLSGKAFELLQLLIEQRPRAINKRELFDALWPDTFVVDASLPVLVREIRSALGDSRNAIRTVHGFGYAFNAEVFAPGETSTLHQLTHAEQVFRLRGGRNVVGRDPDADVFIPSTSVSRRHAAITIAGESATVEDLDSKNGTRVDGVLITAPAKLHNGTIVEFGAIEFVYSCLFPNVETETMGR